MINYRRILLTLALIVFTCSLAQDKASDNALAAHSPQAARTQLEPRVQTIQFESKLVGKTLPYNVLLPVNYNQPESRSKRYPVIYLLHGFSGHYTNWLEKTKLVDYTAGYELIIAMPEGNDAWYTDSATVASDKYESYILQELIPDVEKRFRASSKREDRAIAGLSMGGYGAIKFGLKHPDKFAFAASLSGAFSAASWTEQDLKDPGTIRNSLMQTFGPASSETRAANDVLKLTREAKAELLPYLFIDCGTEDFLFNDNRQFVTLLLERNIKHEYRQLPGSHSWQFWDSEVQEVLRVAAKKLGQTAVTMKTATP